MNSATAVALVLARRALRKSGLLPARTALGLLVDKSKHVWSFWNALKKRLVGVCRHDFFDIRAAHSRIKVMLFDESAWADRSDGKP